MAMRLSGLMSGMDTESIIQELVAAKQTKVDDAKKAQTKLSWKQDAWKTLNTQVMKLYNGTLSNLRFQSSYVKKTTKVSNSNAVSVITGENAVNSVQNLKISQLARSAYMTGSKLEGAEDYKKSTVLTDSAADGGMGLAVGSEINVTVDGESTTIEVTEGMTIAGLTTALQKAGVNASFDEKNQRFFISSKSTGAEQGFTLVGANSDGITALDALGISSYGSAEKAYYTDLANNTESAKAERQQDMLNSLTTRRQELVSGMDSQMKLLTETYKDTFKDIDLSDMTDAATITAVKDKINSLKDTNATAYKALQNWVVDYQGMQQELDNMMTNQLKTVESVNESGDTVTTYELTDSLKEEINQQVEEEAAYAQTVLDSWGSKTGTAANKMDGTDAIITLNGVEFTSTNNTFEINGLTLTVNATTAENEEITITTEDDTDGIYDMVKGFIKEYNALVNQMDKLYNADSAKDYEPLTDEEKDTMSDSAIEEWEGKIKDALLRKDSTLSTFSSAMKEIMSSGVSVNGKTMYLSDFGIETLSYFTAAENEKNAYHIDGDSEDATTSGNADKLKSMIASDPDTVMNFFTSLSRNLYTKMTELTAGTDYSSSYTMYDDKKMKEDYDDYTSKISELEDKLNDYEDKWYSKFSAMETALAKLQSNASAVTSLLGGS